MKHYLLRKISATLHTWKHYYLLAGLLLIGTTFFRMLEPKLLQVAIDGIIQNFQTGNIANITTNDVVAQQIYHILPDLTYQNLNAILLGLAILFVVIALLRGLFMFGAGALNAFATERATKRLRDNLFSHIQLLPLSFMAKNKTGEIIQRCTGDVDTIRDFINNQISDLIFFSSIFIWAVVMMASVHISYTVIAIAGMPFIILNAYYFFKREGDIWEKHEAEQDKLTSIVEENLTGIRVVKAFAQEQKELNRFETQNQAKLVIGKKHVMLHARFWTISDGFIWLQMTVSILAGAWFALKGQITIGELAAFYTYAGQVTFPMRQLAKVVSKMGMARVAFERIDTILEAETENYEGKIPDKPVIGDIEFQNVSFKYPESETYALQNVSFRIFAGQTIAFLGPSGSGKTTIINLLLRLYEPSSGQILLDGQPIQTLNKQWLRQQIGAVLQKPFLFSTTITRNIAHAHPTANEKEVLYAAKSAAIYEIKHLFTQGFDTLVGEKGVTLSGGQKQRVTLARTLLENPAILVLDDATSAVDTETEHFIQAALKKHLAKKTTIIIAHRLSSVQHANQIIVMQNGQITEQGTPNELLTIEDGYFKKVHQVQTALEANLF